MQPFMTQKEISLLDSFLNKSENYVEFGSGGSTLFALMKPNLKKIYSIEASFHWFNTLHENELIQDATKTKRLQLSFVDINGDDSFFSYPKDQSKIDNWNNYYNPWNRIDFIPDFILIDGRWRVTCALYCFIHIQNQNLCNKTVVAIHDYTRDHYKVVEQFLSPISMIDSLCMFLVKENITIDIDEYINKYKYDPQ